MIRIGDEVEFVPRNPEYWRQLCNRFVVTEITNVNGSLLASGIGPDGEHYVLKHLDYWKPTGRHFPQVQELLNAMKEAGM